MSEQTPKQTHEPIPSVDPTLKLGEIAVRDIQAEVLAIFELPETDFDSAVSAFVATRMKELRTDNKDSIGMGTTRVDEFITLERPMILSAIQSRPYHMDDPRAYETAFKWVRQRYEAITERRPDFEIDKRFVSAAVRGTQIGQVEYFGSYVGNARRRLTVVADIIDDDLPESESVAKFGSSAMCLERAAVVHNTLKIMGVDSRLTVGDLHENSTDGQITSQEPHAWIVLRSRTGKFVQYDPTNPILHKSSEGKTTWGEPNLKQLDDSWVDGVDVALKEVRTNEDGSRVVSDKHALRYIYSSSPF